MVPVFATFERKYARQEVTGDTTHIRFLMISIYFKKKYSFTFFILLATRNKLFSVSRMRVK